MNDYEQTDADTTPAEMLRILATDFGVEPADVIGYTILLALREPGGQMRPAVRTSFGYGTTAYLLLTSAAEMQFISLVNPQHPDHEELLPDDGQEQQQ